MMETPRTVNPRPFQDEVRRLTLDVLDSRRSDLAAAGLRAEIEVSGRETEPEIAVYFYAGDEVVDVLEFSPVRNGSPVSSLGEIEAWLQDGVDDVLRRHESRHSENRDQACEDARRGM